MVIAGDPYTVRSLSTTLFHLFQTAGVKLALVKGMRAVAILMVELNKDREVGEIAERVTASITEEGGQLPQMMREASNLVREMKLTVMELRQERSKTIQSVAMALSAVGRTVTYAAVAAKPPSTSQQQPSSKGLVSAAKTIILAKSSAKSQQVLIDEVRGEQGLNSLTTLEPAELVQKANIALESMADILGHKVQVLVVTKLGNGGIVYKLNTPEVAKAL